MKYNKYSNKKVEFNGIKFDSKKEMRRYKELLLLQRAKKINFLELQPKFLLQEKFKYKGKTERAIYYIADFKYLRDDGKVVVEDVKGVETQVFKLKAKMFKKQYPQYEFIVGWEMTLINDNFQNRKRYNIPKAQLVLTDIPYNVGNNAYGSNPMWYKDGDNKNGESELAGTQFFDTDKNFNLYEFFHFCSKLLKPEPKQKNSAGCMIVFCAFEQMNTLIEIAKRYGFKKYINLNFYKNYSPQVLKANMRIVGNTEYALLFYRDKLPKFNNNGQMVFNSMPMNRDTHTAKIHPTQKPKGTIKRLIELFTDKGDVVIDPCAGSGITLLASEELGRKSYGFEIKKQFVNDFETKLSKNIQKNLL